MKMNKKDFRVTLCDFSGKVSGNLLTIQTGPSGPEKEFMKFAEVAENVKQLGEAPSAKDEFIHELLLAYGTPKATIARLKAGPLNLAKGPGEVLLKKKVFFKALTTKARRRSLHGIF
jgi:hypothetical protein